MSSRLAPLVRREILGPVLYGPVREAFRRRVMDLKKQRRVSLGARVTFVFENRDTLRFQIEEMLRAENITTEVGVAAELEVYNGLMPTPNSLSATLFLEIPRDEDAKQALHQFIGIDEHVALTIGPYRLRATFEWGRQEHDRISAVQYVRFPLTPEARAALRVAATGLVLTIEHPNYRHRLELSEAVRASLAADYD